MISVVHRKGFTLRRKTWRKIKIFISVVFYFLLSFISGRITKIKWISNKMIITFINFNSRTSDVIEALYLIYLFMHKFNPALFKSRSQSNLDLDQLDQLLKGYDRRALPTSNSGEFEKKSQSISHKKKEKTLIDKIENWINILINVLNRSKSLIKIFNNFYERNNSLHMRETFS